MLDNLLEGCQIIGPDWRYLYVNDAVARKARQPKERLLGRTIMELYPGIEKTAMFAVLKRCMEEQQPHMMENEFIFPDESKAWFELRFEPVSVGVFIRSMDITERKRAEEALRNSEWRYRMLTENLPQKIFFKDRQSVYISCNENYARDLGILPEEITGRTDYDFFSKELAEKYRADDERLMEGGKTEEFEEQYVQHGKEMWVHTSKTPIRNKEGTITGILGIFWDITERKQAEKDLRKSELKYKTLIDNINSGVAVYEAKNDGEDFIFVDFNKAGENIEKIRKENLIGKSVLDVFPGVKDFGLFDVFKKVWKTGKPEYFPTTIYEDQRIYGWRENYVYKLPSEEIIAVYEDKTEQKKSEEALRESEEKYRNLFNNAEVGMFRTRIDGSEILEMNQKFLDIFGRTREEMQGSPSLIHWADPSEREEMVRRLELEGRVSNFECRMLNKQGDVRVCLKSLKLYHIEGILEGSIIDITERKKTEEALREAENRHRALIDTIPDLIWLKDQNGVYLSCNPTFERFFGAKESEILGKTDYDFVDKSLADFFRLQDHKAMEAGRPRINEEWITFADDGYHGLFETIKTPMRDVEGNLIGVLGIARDITAREKAEKEKQKLENQMLQSQKMEAIGKLAGGIAHDFNNLLTTIIGNADFALDQAGENRSLYNDIEEIREAGQQAAALTRQLLAFSRKQIIQPQILNLNDILENTEKMLRRTIGEDVEFKTMFEPNLWDVKMDQGQIEQILMNLAVNARDAMPDGGKLTVETANVELDDVYFQHHGVKSMMRSYAMLAITDTGTGMDLETQTQIFEPFFTTKERGQGTGLGLSMVYGIVKQNNGYIWVYSEPGKGTTFKIYFPSIEGDEVSDIDEPLDENQLKGSETILVVEDNKTLLKLTRKILESYGYKVLTAQNANEAIETFKRHDGSINLLLTDVVMPGMNGRKLAEQIQSKNPKVKVTYMSGYTDDTISKHGVLYDDVEFIEKPFSQKDLGLKVREVLDQGIDDL